MKWTCSSCGEAGDGPDAHHDPDCVVVRPPPEDLRADVARLTRELEAMRSVVDAASRANLENLRLAEELEAARAAMRDAETLLRRVSYRQDAPPRWSEECRRAADRLAAVLSGT